MNYYNEISEGYDELYKEEQLKKLDLIKDKIELDKNDLLLDVGCGTGITTKFWDCKKIGIDPAFKLLKKASGAVFVNGIAELLPFKKKRFNVVISITAIQNFNDIEKGLREIKRVGKDKFILSALKKSPKIEIINSLIKKIFKPKEIIEEDKDIIFLT